VVEAVEQFGELRPCGCVIVATEADRELAHLLDDREGRVTLLLAQRVTEQAAERADVVAHLSIGEVVGRGQGK
jgi:hypothetical protein